MSRPAASAGAASMLELRDVTAGYGAIHRALERESARQAGEAVAVVGPNGAGKTTLMRAISGDDPDPHAASSSSRAPRSAAGRAHEIVARGIAHVPEGRRIFPALSVARQPPGWARSSQVARASRYQENLARVSRSSRFCAERRGSGPAACPAVSSRCWRWAGPSCRAPG